MGRERVLGKKRESPVLDRAVRTHMLASEHSSRSEVTHMRGWGDGSVSKVLVSPAPGERKTDRITEACG